MTAAERLKVAHRPPRHVVIPGYHLHRMIATGSCASVFLANGIADQQQIAVKVIRHDDDRGAGVLTGLIREHGLLSRLDNRHIVRVFECGVAHDYAFIAMEYCSHGDLGSQMKRGALLPMQAITFLRQIGLGLAASHRRRIVHRDLKPANVLFRDPNTIALADFGAACDLERVTRSALPRAIAGTPAYASPEVIKREEFDGRADLYSAGVMLHQMLTGSLPFERPSVSTMLEAHVHASVPRLGGDLVALQPLLEGLLAKDPDDRFQSAEELLAGLQWIAHQQGWPSPAVGNA